MLADLQTCLLDNKQVVPIAGCPTCCAESHQTGQLRSRLVSLPASRYGRCMIIVLANTKGGVGKSTLAVHLAAWLHDRGAKVALLDCDKQRSSSQWISEAEPSITLAVANTPEDVASLAKDLHRSHDFVVGDGPGGLDDLSRTLLILADLALFPISPSILDLRSVAQATAILKYAQSINGGRPEGALVLNKMKKRDTISRELQAAAPELGLVVARSLVRDLQVYRDAAQQGTVVTRMKSRARHAATELAQLFVEVLTDKLAFLDRQPIAVEQQEGKIDVRKTLAK
jgi:chromosome partitioning protein